MIRVEKTSSHVRAVAQNCAEPPDAGSGPKSSQQARGISFAWGLRGFWNFWVQSILNPKAFGGQFWAGHPAKVQNGETGSAVRTAEVFAHNFCSFDPGSERHRTAVLSLQPHLFSRKGTVHSEACLGFQNLSSVPGSTTADVSSSQSIDREPTSPELVLSHRPSSSVSYSDSSSSTAAPAL